MNRTNGFGSVDMACCKDITKCCPDDATCCMVHKPRLTLIRGLPGSGKSTLAAALLTFDTEHREADMFFIKNGEYAYDKSKIKQAHDWCLAETRAALSFGLNVVVSNTFTQMWQMQPYIDMAKELNCLLNVIECKGQFGNIHNVPEESLERFRNSWEEYIP